MTRASIILREENGSERYFYQHCDGYPTVTLKELLEYSRLNKETFIKCVENDFDEIDRPTSDSEFFYVIDMNLCAIYTFSSYFDNGVRSNLLRVDDFGDLTWVDQVNAFD